MNIAICDLDYYAYQQLSVYIKNYFNTHKISTQSYTVDYYPSIEKLSEAKQNYETVFVDIYMNQINQITKLKKLPKERVKCFIFIANTKEYAVEGFRFGALHYLVKPIIQAEVDESLRRCLIILEKNILSYLNLSTSNQPLYVPCEQIHYIHSNNKRIYVHTSAQSYTTYLTLEKIHQQLDERQFMRAQRGYIVNMDYIADLYAGYIVLKNGLEIKLSRLNSSKIRNQYQEYLLRAKKVPPVKSKVEHSQSNIK